MTTVTREQISIAFFNLIKGAASFTATSRRFVHWDQVNETQMPFLTMLKTGEVRGRQSEGLPTLTINAHYGHFIRRSILFPGNEATTLSLSGFMTSPAGNIRISCRDGTSTNGVIKSNASANFADSTIWGIRIN